MYKFIKIRHDINKLCHVNYKEMKKFNYKLESEILRNSTQKDLGVLRGSFQGFGCPKRHLDTLLAKTMSLRNPQIAGHSITCPEQNSNQHICERWQAVSGDALEHSATRPDPY